MKTLYLDIFSGLSGDMFIGALLDLGVDFHQLEHELEKLGLKEYHLHATRKHKGSIEGVKFDVHLAHDPHHGHGHAHEGHSEQHDEEHAHSHSHEPHEQAHHHSDDEEEHRHAHAEEEPTPGVVHEPPHHHEHEHGHGHTHSHSHEHGHEPHAEHDHDHAHGRTFADIKALISRSRLSDWVKQKAIAVFQRVANAEGKIHGQPPPTVHFHEVGAIDSIVDIVGACIGLELLGRPHVLAAPAVEGTGWIECAHGRFPVPSAATLEILGARGIPLTQCDEPHELITPTGAALLAEFAESFGPMRGLTATKVGYGLGTRDNRGLPNVVRAVLGESTSVAPVAAHDWETDVVTVLETNVDDLSAEVLGHVLEQALALGALDAFHTPVLMKKNRPAVLLTVLCAQPDAARLSAFLLRETSAFGIRHYPVERRKLRREFREIGTLYGAVTVKLGWLDGKVVQLAPEYEACKSVAAATGIPLKEVYAAALQAAREAEL